MTQDQALAIARAAAEAEGWPWEGPFGVWSERAHTFWGHRIWCIYSRAGHRGGNVHVRIDDATGEVTRKELLPR